MCQRFVVSIVNRRRVLSTIGSASALALAGCTSGATLSAPDQQSLRVENVALPDETEIDLQVEVTNGREKSTPPALRVEMETTVDQTLKFGPYRPLSSPIAEQQEDEADLLLIPENVSDEDGNSYYVPAEVGADFVPEEPQGGCWTANTDVEIVNQLAVHVDLKAGDTEANTYRVLNSPDNSECFPAGRYRVEDTVGAGETYYDWSFDIVVE